jgi:hypothetical protein
MSSDPCSEKVPARERLARPREPAAPPPSNQAIRHPGGPSSPWDRDSPTNCFLRAVAAGRPWQARGREAAYPRGAQAFSASLRRPPTTTFTWMTLLDRFVPGTAGAFHPKSSAGEPLAQSGRSSDGREPALGDTGSVAARRTTRPPRRPSAVTYGVPGPGACRSAVVWRSHLAPHAVACAGSTWLGFCRAPCWY